MVRVVTANDAPPTPTGVTATSVGVTSFTLNWAASPITDRHATEPYEVLSNGAHKAWVTGLSYTFTGLTENQTVSAGVKYKDTGGLLSAETKISVKTANAAPPVPGGVVASAPSHTQLTLDWNAVTGITDFNKYQYQREGGAVGDTTATAVTWNGLTPSTTYDLSVRTVDDGGAVSAWVTRAGTTKPNPDTTPPGDCKITSFKPEVSYGRLVVRFTCPTTTDFNSYLMWRRVDDGAWDQVGGWTVAAPGSSRAEVVGDYNNGDRKVEVSFHVRDDNLNVNNAAGSDTYWLVTTPKIIDPTTGGTYRGGVWRNDATCDPDDVFMGRTSSGDNRGAWFYGAAVNTFCGVVGRTITAMYIDYYRPNDQGSSGEIKPCFWTHTNTARSGSIAFKSQGLDEAPRLGPGVGRIIGAGSPPVDATSGRWQMNAAFHDAFQAAAMGIGIFRDTTVSDPDNMASYYMKLGKPDTNGGAPTSRRCGRITIEHLG